jgi:hypothetical protein
MSKRELPIIPASVFLQMLTDVAESRQRLFPLRNVIVSGDIDVETDTFPEGMRLRQIVFENKLTFRGCRFDDEFSLIDCSFREGLDLSGAKFASTVTIYGGTFGILDVASDGPRLVLDFARFDSDVHLVNLAVFGTVSGRSCRVKGTFNCVSLRVSAVGLRSPFNFAHAQIEGNFDLSAESEERILGLTLTATFSRVRDSSQRKTDLHSVIRYAVDAGKTAVNLRNMTVRGTLSLAELDCDGPVDCTSGIFDNIDATLAEIDGELILSATTTKFIRAHGLSLDGSLVMISGTSGRIDIDDYVDDPDNFRISRIRALIMSGWTCKEWARFGIRIIDSPPQWKPPFDIRGIEIKECEFKADLDFRSGTAAAMAGFDRAVPGLAVWSSCWFGGLHTGDRVQITGSRIGGKIDLTNLHTTDVVDLTGTSARQIRFASPLSDLADTAQRDSKHTALTYLTFFFRLEDLKLEFASSFGAAARRLYLRRVEAGEIDLTGLRLAEIDQAGDDGSVIASHATVRRDLLVACRAYLDDQNNHANGFQRFFPAGMVVDQAQETPITAMIQALFKAALQEKFTNPGGNSYLALQNYIKATAPKQIRVATAVIPGALRLENSRIGRLRLSSESFSRAVVTAASATAPKPTADNRGIVLENATVGELFVYRPVASSEDTPRAADGQAAKDGSDNGFPRPVNLRGLTVTSWRLEHAAQAGNGADDEPSESDESGPYLDLLDNDAEYRASTYLGIEKALRDRGHDRAAREVYVAGRYRSHKTDFAASERFKWRPGEGRLRPPRKLLPGMPRLFVRMQRSKGETALAVGLLVLLLVVLGIVLTNLGALITNITNPRLGVALAFAAGVSGFLILLFSPTAVALDRLYWTFLDYGTSAWRLLVLIVGLMIVSFVLVATDPRNVEPTANASLAIKAINLPPKYQALCQPGHTWGTAEAFWMTLRYHIPLVNLGVMEDCQPADGPLHLRYFVDDAQPPKWWKALIGHWPTAGDWFGMMALLNYILWPLFIPFLIQQIFRRDRQS